MENNECPFSGGDILQISPEHEKYPGFLVVVTDPKSWGAQGYLMHYCDFDAVRYKDKAYVRVRTDQVHKCGTIEWLYVDSSSDEDND